MTLTQNDFDQINLILENKLEEKLEEKLEKKLDEKLDEKLKNLPTKDEFFNKMDEQTLLSHRVYDHEERIAILEAAKNGQPIQAA